MSLIEGVYDAALDHDAWPVFLGGLAKAFEGLGAVLLSSDVAGAEGEIIAAACFDPGHLVSYHAHYAAIDPWTAPFAVLAPGSVASTDDQLPRHVLERTEFYNDWLRPQGIERSLGAVILREGYRFVRLGIPRGTDQGAYEEEAVRALALLVPHLRRGLQLRARLAGVEAGGAADALDRLHMGVVLVDASARVLHMNAAARVIVATGDGLAVVGGALGALRASDDHRLKGLIADAAATTGGAGGAVDVIPGGALALARPSGSRPFSMLVAPPPRDALATGPTRPAAMVFVSDPEGRVDPPRAVLMRLYGLTIAEARLTAALLGGDSLANAAEARGMAKGTARAHLQRIFKKTDTHGQPELIRLLLASPAALVRR